MNTEKEIGTLIQIIAEKNEEIENYKNQIEKLKKELGETNENLDSLWYMYKNLEEEHKHDDDSNLAKEIFKMSQEKAKTA